MRFTGGDDLTGFKKLVNQTFMENELKDGEGAYELNRCKAGRSGKKLWGHIFKCH
jgi:hypothetical protein